MWSSWRAEGWGGERGGGYRKREMMKELDGKIEESAMRNRERMGETRESGGGGKGYG